jgi:hypothetical protein
MEARLDRRSLPRLTALLVAAVIASLAIITVSVLGSGQTDARPLFADALGAQRLSRDVQRFVAAGRHYTMTGDAKDRAVAERRELELRSSLQILGRSVGRSNNGRAAMQELERVIDAIAATVSSATRDASSKDRDPDRVARLEARLVADYSAYYQRLDSILYLVDADLHAFEDGDDVARRARWFVLGLGIVVAALGIAAIVVLDKQRRHLDRISRAAEPRLVGAVIIDPTRPTPEEPQLLG